MRKLRNTLTMIFGQLLFWLGAIGMYLKFVEAQAAETSLSTFCCAMQGLSLLVIFAGLAGLLDYVNETINLKEDMER